jgi:hypothetical protein
MNPISLFANTEHVTTPFVSFLQLLVWSSPESHFRCLSYTDWIHRWSQIKTTAIGKDVWGLIGEYLLTKEEYTALSQTNVWFAIERLCEAYRTHRDQLDISPLFSPANLISLVEAGMRSCVHRFSDDIRELEAHNLVDRECPYLSLHQSQQWLWNTEFSFLDVQQKDVKHSISHLPKLWWVQVQQFNNHSQPIPVSFAAGDHPFFSCPTDKKYQLRGVAFRAEGVQGSCICLLRDQHIYYEVDSIMTQECRDIEDSSLLRSYVKTGGSVSFESIYCLRATLICYVLAK